MLKYTTHWFIHEGVFIPFHPSLPKARTAKGIAEYLYCYNPIKMDTANRENIAAIGFLYYLTKNQFTQQSGYYLEKELAKLIVQQYNPYADYIFIENVPKVKSVQQYPLFAEIEKLLPNVSDGTINALVNNFNYGHNSARKVYKNMTRDQVEKNFLLIQHKLNHVLSVAIKPEHHNFSLTTNLKTGTVSVQFNVPDPYKQISSTQIDLWVNKRKKPIKMKWTWFTGMLSRNAYGKFFKSIKEFQK